MDSLLTVMWRHVRDTDSLRNDFMSHGAYMVLIVILGMVIASFFTSIQDYWNLVGFLTGIVGGFIREEYDRRQHNGWDLYDLLSAFLGTVFALGTTNWLLWIRG